MKPLLIRILAVSMTLLCLNGCSSSDKEMPKTQDEEKSVQLPDDYPPPPASSPDSVTYSWGRNAIIFEMYSTSYLNVYEDRSHNLMLCLYQLSDLAAIDAKINEITDSNHRALNELLNCEPFDTTVTSSIRFFVKPKLHNVFKFDREKDVKHVVLIAGYNSSVSTENILSVKIPLFYNRDGIIFKDDQYTVAPLKMRIFLGQNQMKNLKDGEKFTDFVDADKQKELDDKLDGVVKDGNIYQIQPSYAPDSPSQYIESTESSQTSTQNKGVPADNNNAKGEKEASNALNKSQKDPATENSNKTDDSGSKFQTQQAADNSNNTADSGNKSQTEPAADNSDKVSDNSKKADDNSDQSNGNNQKKRDKTTADEIEGTEQKQQS